MDASVLQRVPGPARVLVVDDSADVAESLALVLQHCGFDADYAIDARLALSRLKAGGAELPQVIVFDLAMPYLDGWRFRRLLADDPRLAGIPLVGLTGTQLSSKEVAKLDVQSVLLKPVDVEVLCRALRACVAADSLIALSPAAALWQKGPLPGGD